MPKECEFNVTKDYVGSLDFRTLDRTVGWVLCCRSYAGCLEDVWVLAVRHRKTHTGRGYERTERKKSCSEKLRQASYLRREGPAGEKGSDTQCIRGVFSLK